MTIPERAALLLIDIQQGFDDQAYWGPRNNPDAERNAARLLTAWRAAGLPVVHIQHQSIEPNSPLRPDRPGVAIQEAVRPLPDEPVFPKSVNSAFIGTGLEDHLRQHDIDTVVICGMTTNHCVETSTRMAGNLGFETWLVGDACATFDRTGPDGTVWPAATVHAVSLASLHGEFATVVSTENLLNVVNDPQG